MSMDKHLQALKEKHAALDQAIDEENARPLPNQSLISDLKKKKLAIKEEMAKITSEA